MKFKRKSGSLPNRIDITPLIDIMFILNIFFMLNAQFISPAGIPITLPKGTTAQTQAGDPLQIFINDLNQIHFEGVKYSIPDLKAIIAHRPKKTPILLKADREASYGKAIQVFDMLRQLDFLQLTLAVQPVKI